MAPILNVFDECGFCFVSQVQSSEKAYNYGAIVPPIGSQDASTRCDP